MKFFKKTYKFICSECGEFAHTEREYCENCGEQALRKATKDDYEKYEKKRLSAEKETARKLKETRIETVKAEKAAAKAEKEAKKEANKTEKKREEI